MSIRTFRKTVAAAGTPERLMSVTGLGDGDEVVIQSLPANTGLVVIGDAAVSVDTPQGIILGVGTDANGKRLGDTVTLPAAEHWYVDSEVNGEGVTGTVVG